MVFSKKFANKLTLGQDIAVIYTYQDTTGKNYANPFHFRVTHTQPTLLYGHAREQNQVLYNQCGRGSLLD
jgi:hypothetical protein